MFFVLCSIFFAYLVFSIVKGFIAVDMEIKFEKVNTVLDELEAGTESAEERREIVEELKASMEKMKKP